MILININPDHFSREQVCMDLPDTKENHGLELFKGVSMLKVGIIICSTRPNRIGEGVGKWVFEKASQRSDAEFRLIDLRDFNLPLLDEPAPAAMNPKYTKEHTRKWAAAIGELDCFIFVTPEYNHGIPGALKNAIDFLYNEWNNKVAGFVAYGGVGGTRVVEQLRCVMAELQVATIRTQMSFTLRADFENYTRFRPADYHVKTLHSLIDQLLLWGTAIRAVRMGQITMQEELDAGIQHHQGIH